MLELSRIPYFVAVAESRSFVKASLKMNVTKSAITTQIRKLEEELNVQLIARTTRQTQLTSAGVDFLKYCLEIMENCAAAEAKMRGELEETSGRVRITATSDTGPLLIAPILADFPESIPRLMSNYLYPTKF